MLARSIASFTVLMVVIENNTRSVDVAPPLTPAPGIFYTLAPYTFRF